MTAKNETPGLTIKPWIMAHVKARKISRANALIVAEAEALETPERGCFKSNLAFAERFGMSPGAMSDLISQMADEGWFSRETPRAGLRVVERRLWINPAARSAEFEPAKAAGKSKADRKKAAGGAANPQGSTEKYETSPENSGECYTENSGEPLRKIPEERTTNEKSHSEGIGIGGSAARGAERPISAEPSKIDSEEKSVAFMVAQGVEEQAARDWITSRNGEWVKRKDWERHCAQAAEAGIAPAEAAYYAAARSWREFHAEWYTSAEKPVLQKRGVQASAAKQVVAMGGAFMLDDECEEPLIDSTAYATLGGSNV